MTVEQLVKAEKSFGEVRKTGRDCVELHLPQPPSCPFRDNKKVVPRNQQPPGLGVFPKAKAKQPLQKIIMPRCRAQSVLQKRPIVSHSMHQQLEGGRKRGSRVEQVLWGVVGCECNRDMGKASRTRVAQHSQHTQPINRLLGIRTHFFSARSETLWRVSRGIIPDLKFATRNGSIRSCELQRFPCTPRRFRIGEPSPHHLRRQNRRTKNLLPEGTTDTLTVCQE